MSISNITLDRYKEMSKDYLITKDMVMTYAKFHPNTKSRNAIKVGASRILSNINFNRVKEEVCREIEPDLEKNVQECLNVLKSLSETAIKQSDRILASTNYLKFTMGEKSRTIMTEDRKAELDSIAKRLGITN